MQEANEKRGDYSVGIFLNCTTEKNIIDWLKDKKEEGISCSSLLKDCIESMIAEEKSAKKFKSLIALMKNNNFSGG